MAYNQLGVRKELPYNGWQEEDFANTSFQKKTYISTTYEHSSILPSLR